MRVKYKNILTADRTTSVGINLIMPAKNLQTVTSVANSALIFYLHIYPTLQHI